MMETLGNITLYNADCMDLLRQMPDKAYDLAIVDPPYGSGSIVYSPRTRTECFGGYIDKYEIQLISSDPKYRKRLNPSVSNTHNTGNTIQNFDSVNIPPNPEYFEQLFRVSKHQIIWGGNNFILPPSRGFVIWVKTHIPENFSMAMAEFAWLSFDVNSKVFQCSSKSANIEKRFHPTQKPVALYKWLLTNYAKEGDRILDTHLGSGSIAIACHDLGFQLTGIELDPDYYAKAVRRIKDHQRQLTMF